MMVSSNGYIFIFLQAFVIYPISANRADSISSSSPTHTSIHTGNQFSPPVHRVAKNSLLDNTNSTKANIETSSEIFNFARNEQELNNQIPPQSSNKLRSMVSSTTRNETVVEDPHQLSVAKVEKFVKNYLARNNRNATTEQTTEPPTVEHILKVISLATHRNISEKTEHDFIPNVPAAQPLYAEKRRTSLTAGNIVGIIFGVLVLTLGIVYVGMSYYPKARRRSSYTEMFIHDQENEEEIALADYSEARAEAF